MGSVKKSARIGSRYGVRKQRPASQLLDAIERHDVSRISAILGDEDQLGKHLLQEALFAAAAAGETEGCEMLLSAGADPNQTESPDKVEDRLACPPAFSAEHARHQMWMVSTAACGGTALHLAVQAGHHDTVSTLLQHGASADFGDIAGITSLMLACMKRGQHEMTRLLLDSVTSDVTSKDTRHGRTALHFAARVGDEDTLEALINAGSEINEVDYYGNTALMLAAAFSYDPTSSGSRHNESCIRKLVEEGCFVNLVNHDDETAVHLAVRCGDVGAVDMLMNNLAMPTQDVLVEAAVLEKNAAVTGILIKYDTDRFSDSLKVTILVHLICSHMSQWKVNNRLEAEESHDVAREIIKGISDITTADREGPYTENHYTELFTCTEVCIDTYQQGVEEHNQMGLVLLALKHQKYGIAKMLCLAGCRINCAKESELLELYLSQMSHQVMKRWFEEILSRPHSLKNIARAHVRHHTGLDVSGKGSFLPNEVQMLNKHLAMGELDDVQPYDGQVHRKGEDLLNLRYNDREFAIATSHQAVSLYE